VYSPFAVPSLDALKHFRRVFELDQLYYSRA
jgi:hypothetical protein